MGNDVSGTVEERANRVAQMNASFAQEGFEIDPLMRDLQREYIDGTLTLPEMERRINEYWSKKLPPKP